MGLRVVIKETEEQIIIFHKASHAEWLEETADSDGFVVNIELFVNIEVNDNLFKVEDKQVEHSVVCVSYCECVSSIILLNNLTLDVFTIDSDLHDSFVCVNVILIDNVFFVANFEHGN